MKTTKEYSCVKKTKKSLEDSLVSLSREYPINKITVKQICERSELSRNAFYFHYADINALIEDIENNMISYIYSIFDDLSEIAYPDNVLVIIERLTDYFCEMRYTTLMLMDSSYSQSFTKRINKAFSDYFFQYFEKYNKNDPKGTYAFFYEFASSGYCGLLIRWLHEPGEISKRHIVRLSYTFIRRLMVADSK